MSKILRIAITGSLFDTELLEKLKNACEKNGIHAEILPKDDHELRDKIISESDAIVLVPESGEYKTGTGQNLEEYDVAYAAKTGKMINVVLKNDFIKED